VRNELFQNAWAELSPIQRQAAEWGEGALLLLAGPGSGKTRVLTCRLARILESAAGKHFRVLGLTFTNKAANEMKERLQKYVPDQQDRVFLGTFHSFCADILRQHGTHIGIRPDFTIYGLESDLIELVREAMSVQPALHEDPPSRVIDAKSALGMIHRLKSSLIYPTGAQQAFRNPEIGEQVATLYAAYEDSLGRHNALDFDSLILRTHQLFDEFPVFATRVQDVYPFVCMDEFQDTNLTQYRLAQFLVPKDPSNLFAVADDDQIIYQWNGASHDRIKQFVADFKPQVLQLPVNYRCPAEIVELANRLIQYNFLRSPNKKPAVAHAARQAENVVRLLRGFRKEQDEAQAVAADIQHRRGTPGSIVVLARNRRLLEGAKAALDALAVPSCILQRKDEFQSTPLVWLHSLFRLAVDPHNTRHLEAVCGSFQQLTGLQTDPEQISLQAEAQGLGLLLSWLQAARQADADRKYESILNEVGRSLISSRDFQRFSSEAIAWFDSLDGQPSPAGQARFAFYEEERAVWGDMVREITSLLGREASLEAFLQEAQMRSKEPTPKPGTVVLMTIHGAKGREFDHVYLVGAVEDELPSFQSKKHGEQSPEMEEERRNCFVAVTRAKESLTISYADKYRGWPKEPSRFVKEMGLLHRPGHP